MCIMRGTVDKGSAHDLCSRWFCGFKPMVGEAVQLLLADALDDLISIDFRFSTALFSFESSVSLTHFRSYGPITPVSAFKGIRYRRNGFVSGDTETRAQYLLHIKEHLFNVTIIAIMKLKKHDYTNFIYIR